MILQTTNNYRVSGPIGCGTRRLFDELNGGINYHVEHHIFPSVEWQNLKEISTLVEKFCEERGLPYHSYLFTDLVGGQWKRLTGGGRIKNT